MKFTVHGGQALQGRVTWARVTHEGGVREHNEDTVLADSLRGLLVVADGMGGHAAGEVASELAVETLLRAMRQRVISASVAARTDILRQCAEAANLAVYDAGHGTGERRMGTTLDAALLSWPDICGAHVGDSRVYCLRRGQLEQVTRDHTLVAALMREGIMTAEQAAVSPVRHQVTRCLGTQPTVEVDTWSRRLAPGDVFLLCSDGLTGALSDAEIARWLVTHESVGIRGATVALMRSALPRSEDNVSAVTLRVEAF